MSTSREVGPFEVLEKLGAGGMGEVYKARDRRLNRLVAIKFLPESSSETVRERFQREALAIAALSHPHICTLYEVGSDQGQPYLVLELLEGETLRSRLARGAVSPEQWMDWGGQIADALDAAHRKGVLHRDLKPDNIFVSPSGHLKVLDFGLAQLESPAPAQTGGNDRTLTSPGMTLGTVPYMSPEQARGEALDPRSDLFSLGAVLYEMASGKPAFPSRSAAETIAAILKEQPARLRQVRPEVPIKIEEVINRCLEKDPDLRYQSAADLRSELKRLKRESGSAPAAEAVPSLPSTPAAAPASSDAQIVSAMLRRHWRWPAVAAVLLAAGAIAWWHFATPVPAPLPSLSFRQLTFTGHVLDAAISPDGKFLAHVDLNPDGTSLHLLSIGSGSDVQIVPPGNGCCNAPTFPPDGSAVYFQAGSNLEAVPVLGGAVRPIASHVCSGAGFSPDGSQIAYLAISETSQLWIARPDGSQPHLLRKTAPGSGYASTCWGSAGETTHPPSWSPDGRHLAVINFSVGSDGRVEVVDAGSGQAVTLAPSLGVFTSDPNWLPDGRGVVLTEVGSQVPQSWLIPYPDGPAQRLTNDLQGYSNASVSATGTLALLHNAPQFSIWIQASSKSSFAALPGGGATQDGSHGLAWTPQNGLVTTRTLDGQVQIWTLNADGSSPRSLAVAAGLAGISLPVVAANGDILFQAGPQVQTWRMHPDGSGLAKLVSTPAGSQALFPALVDGGQAVAYDYLAADGSQTLWKVPLAGGAALRIWPGATFVDGNPASPDGSRIFVESQGPAKAHVAVVVAAGSAQPQVTPLALDHATMHEPYGWTPDGRAITYIVNQGSVDNLWALPLAGGKPYAVTHFNDLRIAAYAFSRDGRLALSRGSQNTDAVIATGLGGKAGNGH